MAKKKPAPKKRKTPEAPPILRSWIVQRVNGDPETVLAHHVEVWDSVLTFTVRQAIPGDEFNAVVKRAFAPGQWLEFTLESEPTAAPLTTDVP
jgi:hypothetical protein